MSARHDATEEVVGVSLHSTERHVSSRPHEGNVQPHGDMLQLGPLQLVHRAGISWTDRVGSDVATALHPIRNGVHSQVATCLGEHVEAARVRVVALDSGLHTVDEVRGLVHVAGQMHAKVLVDFHGQGHRWPACDHIVLLVVVVRIRLPVHLEVGQLPLALGREEHPDGEVIDVGGPFPRTSGNRGVGYLAIELLNVPGRRRPMAGPGLVAKADTLQKLLCGHRGPQRDQLLAQGLVFAAPHLVELDLVHHVPLRTVRGFGGLHAWELPEVACKDEDGNPVCRLPHLDNALEVLLGELGDLVDRDHVVLRQTVHYFHRILVEEEGAGTGVHVRFRVLAPDPGCLLGRGQCIQHSASLSQAPADAFVDHSGFASAWRSSRCLRPVRLSFLYDVVILRVVRCLPRRLGPVQQLADAFLQSFLPLVEPDVLEHGILFLG